MPTSSSSSLLARLRPAFKSDSRGICTLQKRCWLTHYKRPLQGLDEKALLQLGGFKTDFARKSIETSLDLPFHKHFIIPDQAETIGWACCHSEENQLIGLYIRPDMQKQGLGSALLVEMMRQTLNPAAPMKTFAVAFNAPSIAFYTKHGFTQSLPAKEGWQAQKKLKKLPLIEMTRPPDENPKKISQS